MALTSHIVLYQIIKKRRRSQWTKGRKRGRTSLMMGSRTSLPWHTKLQAGRWKDTAKYAKSWFPIGGSTKRTCMAVLKCRLLAALWIVQDAKVSLQFLPTSWVGTTYSLGGKTYSQPTPWAGIPINHLNYHTYNFLSEYRQQPTN